MTKLTLYRVPIPDFAVHVRADGPTEAEHAAMDFIDGMPLTDCVSLVSYGMDNSLMAEEVELCE